MKMQHSFRQKTQKAQPKKSIRSIFRMILFDKKRKSRLPRLTFSLELWYYIIYNFVRSHIFIKSKETLL